MDNKKLEMRENPIWIDYREEVYSELLPQEELVEWTQLVLNEVSKRDCMVSLSFVDDQKIRELNLEYRNKDSKTDVLSFSQVEGEEFVFPNAFLGDIVIAVPYVVKQAKGLGHSPLEEVKYLILHGVLHLLGYDHDEQEEGEMSVLEKQIYKKLTGDTVE